MQRCSGVENKDFRYVYSLIQNSKSFFIMTNFFDWSMYRRSRPKLQTISNVKQKFSQIDTVYKNKKQEKIFPSNELIKSSK